MTCYWLKRAETSSERLLASPKDTVNLTNDEDKHHLPRWEDCEWAGALDDYQASMMVYWTQMVGAIHTTSYSIINDLIMISISQHIDVAKLRWKVQILDRELILVVLRVLYNTQIIIIVTILIHNKCSIILLGKILVTYYEAS